MILRLETEADYPHNGMSGIVFADATDDGDCIVGLGENFGVEYTLVGSDGGAIGRPRRRGHDFLLHGSMARSSSASPTGFWNPFSICAAPADDMFCVDNDPDASPPCRLIDVLPAGDYGFRYEYGRAGVHPLQAWNGELPGTLPMICGVGEAPTAIVHHRGYLWVTSWGDHRIERYRRVIGATAHRCDGESASRRARRRRLSPHGHGRGAGRVAVLRRLGRSQLSGARQGAHLAAAVPDER